MKCRARSFLFRVMPLVVSSRGTITVKSDQTEKTYTFYVGRRIIYYPQRYPVSGETVKIQYINDRGFLKASRVDIVQGP